MGFTRTNAIITRPSEQRRSLSHEGPETSRVGESTALLGWNALRLASAYFWFKASVAIVSDEKSGQNPGIELRYTDKKTGKQVRVVATAMEQSRLNKIAALLTGSTVLFQALAAAIP